MVGAWKSGFVGQRLVRAGLVLAALMAHAGSLLAEGSLNSAVTIARATEVPQCALHVDAAAPAGGAGTAQKPYTTIGAALAAANAGAMICVAEGTYAEQLTPGEKHVSLAGGFQRGKTFTVRDSATYVTKAVGRGGSFFRVDGEGPKSPALTSIDGFDISGYARAIVRQVYYSQRFDITNNHIHDNRCADDAIAGGGFALTNVSGKITGNVLRNNSCGSGGAGFLDDDVKENTVTIENNLIDGNAGTEPTSAHGGALYLFGTNLRITGNVFTDNTVTGWGAGLYIGAWIEGGKTTTARMNWNVYRSNKAGNGGGGLFCDDGATCLSFHEIYDSNCGSNIYLDGGSGGPTVARFEHLTNVGAREVGCGAPGAGVRIDRNDNTAPDAYTFINALFWGNAPGLDFAATCDAACDVLRVTVSHSMVQTTYLNQGLKITFGEGIVAPIDPLFAAADKGDFHLRSRLGRWTPSGHVTDQVSSPVLARGFGGGSDNAKRAGVRNELGAYGNSREASFTQ